jgi:transposase-like protein
MKRRHWRNEEKFKIVLEGLQGSCPVAELCSRHEIHQSQYYQWRDQFFREGKRAFETNHTSRRESQMEKKIVKMEQVIGKLTLELKKND